MDRITQVRIRNVRAIEALDLDVSRMTVLIGENGAGKSTIIECLEILRQAAEPRFMERLYAIHQGVFGLLRRGATSMKLGVTIEDTDGRLPALVYDFALGAQHGGLSVSSEYLISLDAKNDAEQSVMLGRPGEGAGFAFRETEPQGAAQKLSPGSQQLALTMFGSLPPNSSIVRAIATLAGIEVHLSFDAMASWAARSLQLPQTIRASATLFPTKRLRLLGSNLASAWYELRNQTRDEWEYTLGLARLGLGEDLDNVLVLPDAGGGSVGLSLRYDHFSEPVPAAGLSNGQLAWLAFIAICRLHDPASLLVIDEPELHLHPGLLGRVVAMLQALDGPGPVVLATHADRVLSLLEDPTESVRVLSLEAGKVVQRRVDATGLAAWQAEYGDLGAIRAEGLLQQVLLDPVEVAVDTPVVVPEGGQ